MQARWTLAFYRCQGAPGVRCRRRWVRVWPWSGRAVETRTHGLCRRCARLFRAGRRRRPLWAELLHALGAVGRAHDRLQRHGALRCPLCADLVGQPIARIGRRRST